MSFLKKFITSRYLRFIVLELTYIDLINNLLIPNKILLDGYHKKTAFA